MTVDKVTVSVLMITYNHEKYIAKAIESILMQKTTFSLEVVIGEDCSKDNTRSIIAEYQNKHPEIVKPIYHETNVGPFLNLTSAYNACQGKYIAMLEGDDFWCDPLKLEKQISFLESNPDFSFTSHFASTITSAGEEYKHQYIKSKEINTFDDIIASHFIPTCSLVFRNRLIDFPKWFFDKQFLSADMAIELMLAHYGKCFHFQEIMAVHIKHIGGITNSEKHQKILNRIINKKILYEGINAYTHNQYKSVDRALASVYLQYVIVLLKSGDVIKAIKFLLRSFMKDPLILVRNSSNLSIVLKNLLRK